MLDKKKKALTNVLIPTVGVGLLFLVFKNRARILQGLRYVWNYKNPLKYQTIEVVENLDDCRRVTNKLKQDCNECKVLGFDCEWVTVGGSRRPTALLQLASHRGLCALIRLCCFTHLPKDLREILEDENILKVGVAPQDDAVKLSHDFGVGVASTLDLRFLVAHVGRKPEGLARLSKSIINIELDKNWRIRCSNWEAKVLTDTQAKYAANDAHVAVEIFKKLTKEIRPRYFWQTKTESWKDILTVCEPFLDIKFKDSMFLTITKVKNKTKFQEISKENSKKQFNRNMSTRSKHLYDNCLLQAPDGELLCTCDRKKAQWYIYHNLGTIITEDPFTVRLNFEPAGRAVGEVGKYYTLAKINQCVVCGRQDAYIRKNVVPREYRKHFPVVMKSHTSHDVLLLCPPCHQLSNISDLKVREKLAKLCDAPFSNSDGGAKYIEIPKLRQLRSAARALLYNSDKIPENKQKILRETVLADFPPGTDLNQEILEHSANINILEEVDNYCSHGLKVVNDFKEKYGGLVELEKLWREHFLNTMHPQHLPDLWSITHNANRLEIRASEGRIEKDDMEVAGLDPNILASEKQNALSEEKSEAQNICL